MAFLASFLVQPVVLYGFVSFLFLWAIVSGLFAFHGVRKLERLLAQAKDDLSAAPDQIAFAIGYEAMAARVDEIDIVGPRWRAFRTTLLLPERPNRPIQSTELPDRWFDMATLAEAALRYRYHGALPGLLVGAGLLFTFLGLAAALGTAGGIVAEGVGQIERNQALKTLLETASFKFLTSIAGLFASMVYTIFWKAICQRRLSLALDDFITLIEACVPLRTTVAAQDEQTGLLQRQLAQMETFSSDLAVSMGAALDGALDQRLGDHIGPLARAVEQLKDSIATQNQDAISGMLEEFLKRLHGSAGDSMNDAANQLARLGQDLTGLKDTLAETADRMAAASERMSVRMGEGAEQAISRMTAQCRATIKVRIPDNQDEKVVAGLVPQGGRSPTGGASPATTGDRALARASIVM